MFKLHALQYSRTPKIKNRVNSRTIKNKLEASDKYIDQHYHFEGKWDVPSLCGLKVIEKDDRVIVIATNLYEINPGTSISRWTTQLASKICDEFKIDFSKLKFIERNPDRKSNLDFYKETFDLVEFEVDGSQLSKPKWKRLMKDEFDELIS